MNFGQVLFVYRTHMRMSLDAVLLLVLCYLNSNLQLVMGPTTQRGFFCDDESLMYPYQKDTVTSGMLQWLVFNVPLMALLILESARSWLVKRTVGQCLWSVYNTVRWFLFGSLANCIIKNLGKHLIGRLRPHFFAICVPQLADGGFCTDSAHRQDGVYHTIYTCQQQFSSATPDMLMDAHISFPSGHTSRAFYGLLFIAFYSQRLRWTEPTSLLRPVGQLLCVALASFIGLSRVTDYKHHWSDVMAGALLGTFIAFAVVLATECELRVHRSAKHVNSRDPQTAAETDVKVATGQAQLPHDLCLVTCHSSSYI